MRRNGFFADVPERDWNDWHWQVDNRIETLEALRRLTSLTPAEERGVETALTRLRMAVTPYYISLADLSDPFDPIRRQAIPTTAELEVAPEESADPLHEDADSPVCGLVHRYPDRVLLLVTDKCAAYCRHCTRRRFAGQTDRALPAEQVFRCIDYVAEHGEVRDVLLSGGDPLMLEDDELEEIIARLRAIPHVEIVRIGSRAPVVCPQRITEKLCAMLRQYTRLAQYAFQSPERAHGGGVRRLRAPGRRGRAARQPVGPAARRERLCPRDGRACPWARADSRQAVLSV